MDEFDLQKERNKIRVQQDVECNLTKKCSMCSEVKNIEHFKMKNKRYRKNGFYNDYCNDCQRLYMKEYMRIYRERIKKNVCRVDE